MFSQNSQMSALIPFKLVLQPHIWTSKPIHNELSQNLQTPKHKIHTWTHWRVPETKRFIPQPRERPYPRPPQRQIRHPLVGLQHDAPLWLAGSLVTDLSVVRTRLGAAGAPVCMWQWSALIHAAVEPRFWIGRTINAARTERMKVRVFFPQRVVAVFATAFSFGGFFFFFFF